MDAASSVRCVFINTNGHICDSCDPIDDTQFYLVTTMLGLSDSFHLCGISFEVDENMFIECRVDCQEQDIEQLNVMDLHSVVVHCLLCWHELMQRFIIEWRVPL